MLAYQIGVEVECKVAEAISAAPLSAGFPQHRDVRVDRRRSGRRETSRPRSPTTRRRA